MAAREADYLRGQIEEGDYIIIRGVVELAGLYLRRLCRKTRLL
jgi:hypothetical protein